MDQVFITDLIARGIIGLNPWEHEKPQEILINIVLFADSNKAGISDNVDNSANYRTIAKKVLAHAETVQRQTVEALAADLAGLCREEWSLF
jgi:FolB domain-containing protein